ncbi:fructosamine kinase family protein [Vibrio nitrifigilis]|uniref:Fructosamine kinase family protein n=1 Tax=Vibrio nitrifigilis TaxID=2789781 RepID=A0ABS0GDS2_9VIBR|nr:fructosamine kinase family protein [Vibrio nitrifigilis]MBF9000515.1 fructosamine kinase family protein [Vibrio nitrifigilis]
MWPAIAQQLSDTLMFEYNIQEKRRISGGDISQSYMISDGRERYFVKTNEREFLPHYLAEEASLKLLKETRTVFVPEVVLTGQSKQHSFIILNYLPTHSLEDTHYSREFGIQLAHLHKWGEQKQFGFDEDNYIGTTIQPNAWTNKWSVFFAEQRIGWMLQLLKEKGLELVDIPTFVSLVQEKLSHHDPRPSLLHGDLWSGNAGQCDFGPVCYDPASYWGDRECDLAMTELFGGFHTTFYEGYESVWPLDNGYYQRKDIYNLYHLLNHYHLFGGQYLTEVETLIKKIQQS